MKIQLKTLAVALSVVFIVMWASTEPAQARKITQIRVEIHTSDLSEAGTDGDVYLGICGREFLLDTAADDFGRGSITTSKLGASASVSNKERNDPREPQLDTDDLGKFPIYIRFETPPSDPSSDWNVTLVTVHIEGRDFGAYFPKGLWLGRKYGKFCYLREGKFEQVRATPDHPSLWKSES